MFKFIREAMGEFEHVVWPTKPETAKYMRYVIGIIIVLALYLAGLGYAFTNALGFTRQKVQAVYPTTVTATGADANATQADLDNFLKNLKVNTGATATGTASSGVILPSVDATGSAQ